jgi:hypothetical protein
MSPITPWERTHFIDHLKRENQQWLIEDQVVS